MNSGNLVRTFKRLARESGVTTIRLHDLRHTHASLLALRGVSPKVIADRLGHTNVAFTLQTYTHVYEAQRREAAFDFQELTRGLGSA
jgi:integrase